ncbi:hypothetical protein ACFQZX_00890 [Mucilaginibacter litoreus]|uniref:Uncharacterized protein n=1 Tax=Mucilaginibacter litoreus TaxID=1048221 RepID=A0ABW3AN54_9SPHI
MSKQHNTIPNEPEEMPERNDKPEINKPADPSMPEIPKEAPDDIPPEITPDQNDEGAVHPG